MSRYSGELDPRRNIDEECGYPTNPTSHDLLEMFVKDAYANRVCQVWPKECFQVTPDVYETEKDRETPFEKAWDAMCSTYGGGLGLHQGDRGALFWETVMSGDILSRIGSYGVILIGLNDGKDPREPVDLKSKKERELLYLRALPESMAVATRLNNDPKDPRFGQPEEYNVSFNDTRLNIGGMNAILGATVANMPVHWSRVVHLAENRLTSVWQAESALRPVLPQVMNLRKIAGGSAEMFWKGGFNGTFFGSDPKLGGDVEIDMESFKEQMELWQNGLQRWLVGKGLTAQPLAPNVADPMNHILVQIEGICIQIEMPKRIFMGSERGELASSQDDAAWNDRVKRRQNSYLTPRVIVPLIERLVMMGVLPVPKQLFVDWPDITSQTPLDKATLAQTQMTTVTTYISGGGDAVIPRHKFYTDFLGKTPEEADAYIEEADADAEEAAKKQAEMGLNPDGTPMEDAVPGAQGAPPPMGGAPVGAEDESEFDPESGGFDWAEEDDKKPTKNAVYKLPSGKWRLTGRDGESLGTFETKEAAEDERTADIHKPRKRRRTDNANPKGCNQYTHCTPKLKQRGAGGRSPASMFGEGKLEKAFGKGSIGVKPVSSLPLKELDLTEPVSTQMDVKSRLMDLAREKGKRAFGMTQFKGDNSKQVLQFLDELHTHSLPELQRIAEGVGFLTPAKATRTDVMKALSARMLKKFGGVGTWFRKAAATGQHIVRVKKKTPSRWFKGKKKVALMKKNLLNCRQGEVKPGPCPKPGSDMSSATPRTPRSKAGAPKQAKPEHDEHLQKAADAVGMSPEDMAKKFPALASVHPSKRETKGGSDVAGEATKIYKTVHMDSREEVSQLMEKVKSLPLEGVKQVAESIGLRVPASKSKAVGIIERAFDQKIGSLERSMPILTGAEGVSGDKADKNWDKIAAEQKSKALEKRAELEKTSAAPAEAKPKGSKNDIAPTAEKLLKHGYEMEPAPFDMKKGTAQYDITGPDGKTTRMTSSDVKKLVKEKEGPAKPPRRTQ